VYDVVASTACVRKDVPPVSLAGRMKWWPRKKLEQFAVTHLSMPARRIADVFNRISEAVTQAGGTIPDYSTAHPQFREIGQAYP